MAADSREMSRHQILYKAKTPPWKEVYRSRCKERVRKQRQVLFDRFRCIEEECERERELAFAVNCIVRQEWDDLRQTPLRPQEGVQGTFAGYDEDERLIADMQREILHEERKILSQYEDTLKSEAKAVDAAVELWAKDGVLCPVCFRNYLTRSGPFVACPCGLVLRTDKSVEGIQQAISDAVASHSSNCTARPLFSPFRTGSQNDELWCTCDVCDFLCPLV
ncbi:RPA-interacting protein A-like [Ornithodoros turicata]|uniref:RPA-interacting protein A-like n=1 Tax=Ornithodoros turicata TaxID=34597 RepID=UPI003138EA60